VKLALGSRIFRIFANNNRMDTTKDRGKVINPIDFSPDTIQGILPKDFALELVRRYKEIIAPHFDSEMKVMMFGSYANGHPHEWSDIDVAVIVPKVNKDKWMETVISLNRAVDTISCYIEPILLESNEDTPIYREVMRTGVAV
jgi:predicted nucleotidyltransferase